MSQDLIGRNTTPPCSIKCCSCNIGLEHTTSVLNTTTFLVFDRLVESRSRPPLLHTLAETLGAFFTPPALDSTRRGGEPGVLGKRRAETEVAGVLDGDSGGRNVDTSEREDPGDRFGDDVGSLVQGRTRWTDADSPEVDPRGVIRPVETTLSDPRTSVVPDICVVKGLFLRRLLVRHWVRPLPVTPDHQFPCPELEPGHELEPSGVGGSH